MALLALFCLCGCQSGGPALRISPEQAKTLNLSLSGGVAADGAGSVYLTTPDGLQRYDPGRHRLENLLNESVTDLRDVAVTSDGVVLAVRPKILCALAAGYLLDVQALPAEATALSCDREFAYLLLRAPKGARLIRYNLTGDNRGRIQTILTTADRPQAICAVRGGCLVVSGGNIVKVTDPVPSQDNTQSQVGTALLVAVQAPITSVVADQARLIVYFSTASTTYAWIQGQVIPIFPAGSRLAWAKDTLTICLASPSNSQVIQIPNVSRHTQGLIKKLSPTTRPPSATQP